MECKSVQTHTQGAALLFFVMFFMAASIPLVFLMSKSIYADLASYRVLTNSKMSFMIAESAAEDIAYRRLEGNSVDVSETVSLFGGSATVDTVVDSANGTVDVESEATYNSAVRKSLVALKISSGASFNFGVQSGNGGFDIGQSAKVIGNVFSNGPITGSGGTGPNQSIIQGDVTSAGPSGVIDGIHATSSARANSIGPSISTYIEGDAFCQTIDLGNTTVSGNTSGTCPGSSDPATTSLPFPDEKVNAFKATITKAIADGVGTLIPSSSCSGGVYSITTDTTFSQPTKIECDFELKKQGASTVLTLLDNLWVTGDIYFKSGPKVLSSPAVSTSSVLIIADNESDRINSSRIFVENGTEFSAPTSPKSYVMLVSMNDSAETGTGSEVAISMGQSSEGDVIVYSGHGEVNLGNSIELKEVTGYLISMGQSAVVEYESGLIDLNFVGGPGGGFELDSWSEIE